ncbi:uncharacterized protein KZ484_024863 [Pholidichthys leucotaenia]
MSDLDTLVVSFQTQLSDVMETVVKTAMFEVTRLVEDVFLAEVKRRSKEVESLKMQLQWTEDKFSERGGKGGGKTGRCVDCGKDDVELSADHPEDRLKDEQEAMLRVCSVKRESDSAERWPSVHLGQEVTSESPCVEADNPTATKSPAREPQASEQGDAIPMKEEVSKLSCSAAQLGGWSCTSDDNAGPESENGSETADTQPKETQGNDEEPLRNVTTKEPPIVVSYGFFEKECDPEKNKADTIAAGDEISSSQSPKVRLKCSDALGVTVKKEVNLDSNGCEERELIGTKIKSALSSVSWSVKQQRMNSDTHKLNISHKAAVQEVMKLNSKFDTGLRLPGAIQHLHRPLKKTPHLPSNSSGAALSTPHSQSVHVNNLNRVPSTSKATPSASLLVQRVLPGDKHPPAFNRTGTHWAGARSQHQSVNATATSLPSRTDSNAGPRHLLRCGQCGKCFPHPSNLKAHLQTHTGERPFCCSLCGRSFTKLSNLKAHRRVHTGERPYCCLACGKRFTQKCNLKRHQRIHLDVC